MFLSREKQKNKNVMCVTQNNKHPYLGLPLWSFAREHMLPESKTKENQKSLIYMYYMK